MPGSAGNVPSLANEGIFSPKTLPCGRVLRNRLVKVKPSVRRALHLSPEQSQVAMYEHLAKMFGGPPNQHHHSLYSQWSRYDWGMIITGNVQVSSRHLTLGRDMVLPESISGNTLKPFRDLALSIHGEYPSGHGAMAIMQLSHAGRQSSNFIGGRYPFERPLSPSEIRVHPKNAGLISGILYRILFQTPRTMTQDDIDEVVAAFVRGARVAAQSGFDGVQLHVAHGCKS